MRSASIGGVRFQAVSITVANLLRMSEQWVVLEHTEIE
jgi:hypothetical protein